MNERATFYDFLAQINYKKQQFNETATVLTL